MTWELIVGPEAEAEIAEARDWYDEREPGLGADFIAVVRSALTAIAENPFQYQIVWKHYRRLVLHPFPYNVIRVVACIHGRRNPELWQDRI